MQSNPVAGSEIVRVRTATSDNETASALEIDLFKYYDWSVRCVVHSPALVVNNVSNPVTE